MFAIWDSVVSQVLRTARVHVSPVRKALRADEDRGLGSALALADDMSRVLACVGFIVPLMHELFVVTHRMLSTPCVI